MKINKADYEEKLKELDEAKTKEKELSQKLQEEKEQNNISAKNSGGGKDSRNDGKTGAAS